MGRVWSPGLSLPTSGLLLLLEFYLPLTCLFFGHCMFAGCPGAVQAYRGGPEEPEGGSGDEEPADPRAGAEDLRARENGTP